MLYLAIILVTALALVIFLHNDHDRSYDKKERRIIVQDLLMAFTQ